MEVIGILLILVLIIMIFMRIIMIHSLSFTNLEEQIKLSIRNMPHVLLHWINQLLMKLILLKRVVQRKFTLLGIVIMLRGSNKCGFINLLINHYCWLQGTRSRIFILNNGCSRINDIVITLLSKLDKIQAKDALKSVEN